MSSGLIYETCQCCCSLRQTELNWCIPVSNIITLGPTHRHFFEDLIMMQILLVVAFFIYALFAFVTNIVASSKNRIIKIKIHFLVQIEKCVNSH